LRGSRFSINQDGIFVQSVDYQPFGESKSTGAAPGTPDYTSYQWNGGEALAEFGLSHLGARVYDPVIGRFLSRDPLLISRTASSSNPYMFAVNDPWNAADPSGLDALTCDEECQNNNIGFQPFSGSSGADQGSSTGIISADWLELHHQASPPPALSIGPKTQAGVELQNAVSSELGYAPPQSFNWDKLAEYGFTPDEALERVKNSISPERDAQIDAENAHLDRIANTGRVVGFTLFVVGSGGAALAETGAYVLGSYGYTAAADVLVGAPSIEAGASAGAGAIIGGNEAETAIDELQSAEAAAVGNEVESAPEYYIENGVRRSVASQQRGLSEIPAIINRPGQAPVNTTLNLNQLYSPKTEIPFDQRFLNIVPPIQSPIQVQPLGLPGQVPSVPLSQVRIVPPGR
jgi:RHS repeat-associated protein